MNKTDFVLEGGGGLGEGSGDADEQEYNKNNDDYGDYERNNNSLILIDNTLDNLKLKNYSSNYDKNIYNKYRSIS